MPEKWQDWVMLALGLWLSVSPFALNYTDTPAAARNAHLVGAAVSVLAIAALAGPALWSEWVNAVLGIWLVVSAFVLARNPAAFLNLLIVGNLVVADGLAALFLRSAEARKWPEHPGAQRARPGPDWNEEARRPRAPSAAGSRRSPPVR